VGTTSGSEHTTRQNKTEVKPDEARKIRWGEGAGVALCGCGRPLSGDEGGGQGAGILTLSRDRDGRTKRPACVPRVTLIVLYTYYTRIIHVLYTYYTRIEHVLYTN